MGVLDGRSASTPGPPGLGPTTRAEVPAGTAQLVVVRGAGADLATCHVAAYERDASRWRRLAAWDGHNGRAGWTSDHREGDLRSPAGAFGLGDAGGLLAYPEARLPYDRSDSFRVDGTGLGGEPLAGCFDHVVAIDYNRVPGRSPLDPERPRGREHGGGIWLHVDHGGGSRGCVTVSREAMRWLLRWLDPARRPVVVMGDADRLSS